MRDGGRGRGSFAGRADMKEKKDEEVYEDGDEDEDEDVYGNDEDGDLLESTLGEEKMKILNEIINDASKIAYSAVLSTREEEAFQDALLTNYMVFFYHLPIYVHLYICVFCVVLG